MAGAFEGHFTDSPELYVLVEGDEWAHVEALDSDAGYWARLKADYVYHARAHPAFHAEEYAAAPVICGRS